MNYLAEAKENISLVGEIKQAENVNALMNVTQALALVAIAEQLQSIDYKIGAGAEHTQRIAEQLEKIADKSFHLSPHRRR